MNPSQFLTLVLFVFLACGCVNGNTDCFAEHRSLLLDLKHGFTLPSGQLDSWEPSSDCCGWEGITCDPKSGHVIGLDLGGRKIAGGINSHALFGLTSLQTLNLSNNEFGRISLTNLESYPISIPQPGFEMLEELRQLDLSNGGFGGQIPNGIYRLARLEYLDLSTCHRGRFLELLNPNLPTMIRNLNNLRVLKLQCVDLNQDVEWVTASSTSVPGSVEWVTALSTSVPHLQVLDLQDANLAGIITESFGNLKNLTKVDLSINQLTGVIPASIGKLTKLTHLELSFNSLTGPIPVSLFSLPSLQRLDLSGNKLSGELDVSLNASTSLREIDLSDNQLCGQIPLSFFYLPLLETLDLRSNNFSGAIELDRIAVLSNLTILALSYNNLSLGEFKSNNFLSFSNLKELRLASCGLTKVPTFLNNQKNIDFLDLSNNRLSLGEFDGNNFSSFPNLKGLRLASCGLTKIPTFLKNQKNMDSLDLSNNRLSLGEFDGKNFSSFPNLKVLILASCGLTEIPTFLKNQKNMDSLDLSNNRLSLVEFDGKNFSSFPNLKVLILASCGLAKVPTFLKNQKNLLDLDLSNNRIGPTIPRWMWSSIEYSLDLSHNRFKNIEGSEDMPMSTLRILYLRSNMLYGPIPIPPSSVRVVDFSKNSLSSAIPHEVFFNLSRMTVFSAAHNNLSGEIPPSICNATALWALDLSNNLFTGSVPSCLLESHSLFDMNLGSNWLQGAIPQNITRQCQLGSLILSDNHLEGSLPRSLVYCSDLMVLDVGKNHIVDTFPFWLGDNPSLQVLSLRANRFYGPLRPSESREQNCTFPGLQIFDLSSNNFNGKLPPICFSGLRRMMNMLDSTRSHLYIIQEIAPSSFYEINIATIKGQDVSLLKILYIVIDFSNNSFEGDIPSVIGGLRDLHVLSLSHNSLTGNIPCELGNLTQLQSLDLSTNHLSGEIPQCLTSLTSLELLNLSKNNLSGRIPQANQFSTFPNASFQENPGLCGTPLLKQCGKNAMPPAVISGHSSSLSSYVIGLALSIGIGYGVGIAIVLVLQNVPLKSLRERAGRCY